MSLSFSLNIRECPVLTNVPSRRRACFACNIARVSAITKFASITAFDRANAYWCNGWFVNGKTLFYQWRCLFNVHGYRDRIISFHGKPIARIFAIFCSIEFVCVHPFNCTIILKRKNGRERGSHIYIYNDMRFKFFTFNISLKLLYSEERQSIDSIIR